MMHALDITRGEPPPLQISADGVVRVRGTRVTLDTIVEAFEQGDSPERISQSYSTVSLPDAYAVIAFYLRHRSEVDAYLQRRRQRAEEVRRENERRFPPDGLRERLLARRRQAA